jgi:hypothetical protein
MVPRIQDAGAMLSEPKVHSFASLGLSNDKEAMEMLVSIAKQVQPIMRKRQWIVPRLSEFIPSNPNLLGINIGGGQGKTKEIKIRLRPSSNPSSFLCMESLLETMLHELVHNVRGPHDSVFYKLLDELKAECEDLMARGISGTGAGFDASSLGRLGSHAFIPIHNPSESKIRDVALQAAEERLKKQRLMSNGPMKLGGDTSAARSLAPGQAAAMAAERRRARDNKWCPSEVIREALDASSKRTQAAKASELASASGRGEKKEIDYIILDNEDELEAVLVSHVEAAGGSEGEGEDGQEDQRGASSSAAMSQGEKLLSKLRAPSVVKRKDEEADKGSQAKAPAPRAQHVVDLTMDDSDDNKDLRSSAKKRQQPIKKETRKAEKRSWQCPSCSIVNPGSHKQCTICLLDAPK